jgi:RNA polymerase sigma-70 factor (ECF subfamily)
MAESEDLKPAAGDRRAISAATLIGAVLVGLGSLYGSTRSVPLTMAGGVLAGVVAVSYLITSGRQHRSARTGDFANSTAPALHAQDRRTLSPRNKVEGAWPVDDEGFDGFFRDELLPLVWVLMKIGAERFEAEDIAQAAMFEVWRRWDTVTNPRAYARKVAVNKFGKARSQRREFPAEQAGEDNLSSAEKLMSTEERRQVVRLLERLPAKQRIVMALTYDEFTSAEIAEIIDAPAATVRAHLREARSKMRQWLTEEGLL